MTNTNDIDHHYDVVITSKNKKFLVKLETPICRKNRTQWLKTPKTSEELTNFFREQWKHARFYDSQTGEFLGQANEYEMLELKHFTPRFKTTKGSFHLQDTYDIRNEIVQQDKLTNLSG